MTDHDRAPDESSRSSVKLSRNSKGETQIEVKAYVGDTAEQVEEAKDLAVRVYNELAAKYGSST